VDHPVEAPETPREKPRSLTSALLGWQH